MNMYVESGTCRMDKVRLAQGGKTIGVVLLIVRPVFRQVQKDPKDPETQEIVFTGESYATIEDNRVIDRLQGKGHGQKMMDLLEDRARELGVSRITLTVSEKREAAIHIYKKRGYRLTTQGYTLRLKPKKEKSE